MEERLQRRVQRYGWDKAAAYYEQFWQQQLEPAQTRLLELLQLQKNETIIETACGTGLLTFRMAKAIEPGGHITGTDISDRMVEMATEIAKEKNCSNTSFQRMEAEELTLPDVAYDVAVCSLGLMYVTDAQQSVNELYRIVKPGGRTGILVWGQRDHCGWADIFPIVDSRVTSDVCPLFFRLGTADILQQVCKQAGFEKLVSERMQTTLQYRTAEDACGAAFVGGPVALAYNRFTEDIKKEARAEYISSIEQYKQGDGYAIPGEFVIVVASK
jgi:ubiquinone/menaquinone biosynthesis C-methylase UbiE